MKCCSSVKFILLNKMCKHHTFCLTQLIFCNNLKPNAKIPLLFVEGTRAKLTSWLAYKKKSSLYCSHQKGKPTVFPSWYNFAIGRCWSVLCVLRPRENVLKWLIWKWDTVRALNRLSALQLYQVRFYVTVHQFNALHHEMGMQKMRASHPNKILFWFHFGFWSEKGIC